MPILYSILFVQVIYTCVLNLFYLERYIGYDCAAVYLQAIEIWNQKTFLIQDWVYTSTLTWDTPLLFSIPLYGITGDFFFAYGLAILISLVMFLWVADQLMTQLNASHRAKVIFTICLLTPFVTYEDAFNRIDYFGVMLSLLGVYIHKTAFILLVWVVFLRLDRPELGDCRFRYQVHTQRFVIGSLICTFFTGVSSGYHVLLFGIVPPLAYGITRNVCLDKWAPHNRKALWFLVWSTVLSVVGKSIGTGIIGRTTHENSLGWTEVTYFWDNFRSIFEGYLVLTGALPHWESPPAFSRHGIAFGFLLALSMGLLVTGVGSMCYYLKNKKDSIQSYFAFIFFVMYLFFVFIYTKYGAQFFEVRYLIPNFMILLIFASIWLSDQLESTNKSARIFLSITVIPCLVVANLVSYYFLARSQNDMELKLEVIDYLKDHESPVVYIMGFDSMIQGQNIRVFDQEKVYLWSQKGAKFTYSGDYTYYCETSEYNGPTVLLASSRDYEELPNYIREQYVETHKFSTLFTMYESKSNPIDYSVGISAHDYNVDYPYTYGMNVADYGQFLDDGTYLVEGNGNFVFWGPDEESPKGTYTFVLHYEVLSAEDPDAIGSFDITVNQGEELVAMTPLKGTKNRAILENIDFTALDGKPYEYRLAVGGGVEILVKYCEIFRVNHE